MCCASRMKSLPKTRSPGVWVFAFKNQHHVCGIPVDARRTTEPDFYRTSPPAHPHEHNTKQLALKLMLNEAPQSIRKACTKCWARCGDDAGKPCKHREGHSRCPGNRLAQHTLCFCTLPSDSPVPVLAQICLSKSCSLLLPCLELVLVHGV